ncbi:MAG: glutamate racemase [Candidatus Marinimicrobia bacterium]|nr:glutamate racemase [Candidatus Neomarinimicrobiota bacterium]
MNKFSNSPIGIFDSGLGGLTVLQDLEKSLPNESFIYFGDTARVPYGNKSSKTVIQYSNQIVQFLQSHHVKMIVIACNTSSALALKTLKTKFNLPMFDVIKPAVMMAEKVSLTNTIIVLGTRATIDSCAYSKTFSEINSKKAIIEKACPLFVPIIEEGLLSGKITDEIIQLYLAEITKINFSQIILGCTHYPMIKKNIQQFLGEKKKLITSGDALTPVIKQFLINNNLSSCSKKKETQFFITDLPQKFQELGSRFLGKKLNNISHISNF